MLAYTNTKYTRGEIIKRTQWHREQDHLTPGIGWEVAGESVRGCMIGCILESYDHSKFPDHIGHPEVLAHLADSIFEGLHRTDQAELANAFPGDYLESAREGADLSMVWPKWCLWMLDGLPKEDVHAGNAVEGVRVLYAEWVETGIMPSQERFASSEAMAAAEAARAAAWAAWDGAVAAAWAAEAASTEAAGWAAEAAARAAVRSATTRTAAWAEAAGWAAVEAARAARAVEAEAEFWRDAREELLRLMREC